MSKYKFEIIEKNGKKYVNDELTEVVMDICSEVFAKLGPGFRERYYQDCIIVCLKEKQIKFETQVKIPLEFKGHKIGNRFFDFLIEGRLVVELKIGDYLSKAEFDQVNEYLRISNLPLGLIVQITSHGVKTRRVVNLQCLNNYKER